MYYFDIEPVAKPRMTQRDRWHPSQATKRFHAYADELRSQWQQKKAVLPDSYHLIFIRQMPLSWSKKKCNELRFQPCRCRPDKDNLEKGFLDAIFKNEKEDDAIVWDGRVSKVWGDRGGILLYPLDPFDIEAIAFGCKRNLVPHLLSHNVN